MVWNEGEENSEIVGLTHGLRYASPTTRDENVRQKRHSGNAAGALEAVFDLVLRARL